MEYDGLRRKLEYYVQHVFTYCLFEMWTLLKPESKGGEQIANPQRYSDGW